MPHVLSATILEALLAHSCLARHMQSHSLYLPLHRGNVPTITPGKAVLDLWTPEGWKAELVRISCSRILRDEQKVVAGTGTPEVSSSQSRAEHASPAAPSAWWSCNTADARRLTWQLLAMVCHRLFEESSAATQHHVVSVNVDMLCHRLEIARSPGRQISVCRLWKLHKTKRQISMWSNRNWLWNTCFGIALNIHSTALVAFVSKLYLFYQVHPHSTIKFLRDINTYYKIWIRTTNHFLLKFLFIYSYFSILSFLFFWVEANLSWR